MTQTGRASPFPNLSWTQNIIKPKTNFVKIKFYLTRNSIILSKQEIEMYDILIFLSKQVI